MKVTSFTLLTWCINFALADIFPTTPLAFEDSDVVDWERPLYETSEPEPLFDIPPAKHDHEDHIDSETYWLTEMTKAINKVRKESKLSPLCLNK
jgi:hypothetical protein